MSRHIMRIGNGEFEPEVNGFAQRYTVACKIEL